MSNEENITNTEESFEEQTAKLGQEKINVKELTFKQGLEELSKTVHLLESNQLELEDSIERYRQGVEILADLQKRLDEAQLTVTELMGKLDDEDMGDIDTRIS